MVSECDSEASDLGVVVEDPPCFIALHHCTQEFIQLPHAQLQQNEPSCVGVLFFLVERLGKDAGFVEVER